MFEQDYKYSKISQLTKTAKGRASLKELLHFHYASLVSIFMSTASTSSYPTISLIDFKKFLDVSKVYDQNISLTTIEQLFVITNDTSNSYKNRDERCLHRYEFIEIIVRLAQVKYKEPKIIPSLRDAVEKMIKDDIIKNNSVKESYRVNTVYTQKVNEIL
jgi:hypothetical protein